MERDDDLNSRKDIEKEFVRYARKRVRQLESSFKQIVETSNANAVHDFRKATRHLQTVIDACGIHRPTRKPAQIRRRLQKCRHSLSGWRDSDAMLAELRKARRKARGTGERQCWLQVIERTAKQRRRALKKFFRKYKSLKVKDIGARAEALVKKRVQSKSMMNTLRLLLERGWNNGNAAIDDSIDGAAAPERYQ